VTTLRNKAEQEMVDVTKEVLERRYPAARRCTSS
jgi:hypothetical protein